MDSIASNLNSSLYHPSPSTARPPPSHHPPTFLLPSRRRRHTSSCWTMTTSFRLPCLLHVTPPATNSKFRLHRQSTYKNKLSTCSFCYYNKASKDDGDHVHGLHHDKKFNVDIGAAGKAVFGFLAAASAFFSIHSHSPALAESLTVAFPVSRAREVLTQSIKHHHPIIITFFQFLPLLQFLPSPLSPIVYLITSSLLYLRAC